MYCTNFCYEFLNVFNIFGVVLMFSYQFQNWSFLLDANNHFEMYLLSELPTIITIDTGSQNTSDSLNFERSLAVSLLPRLTNTYYVSQTIWNQSEIGWELERHNAALDYQSDEYKKETNPGWSSHPLNWDVPSSSSPLRCLSGEYIKNSTNSLRTKRFSKIVESHVFYHKNEWVSQETKLKEILLQLAASSDKENTACGGGRYCPGSELIIHSYLSKSISIFVRKTLSITEVFISRNQIKGYFEYATLQI